jgi:hypothetical protein
VLDRVLDEAEGLDEPLLLVSAEPPELMPLDGLMALELSLLGLPSDAELAESPELVSLIVLSVAELPLISPLVDCSGPDSDGVLLGGVEPPPQWTAAKPKTVAYTTGCIRAII